MYGFDGETTAPAVAMLMACAAMHVDRLAGQDPGRCAVVASAMPAPPGDRLIERRAIALVQLPALLRQLLQLARALDGGASAPAVAILVVSCAARRAAGQPGYRSLRLRRKLS